MKIGDAFEFEKIKSKHQKEKKVYHSSDEEGTLAQAYTRYDNECPDQFDELDSEVNFKHTTDSRKH